MHIPIFSSLSREDLENLRTLWKPVTRNAGQLIFKKGDPGDSMYIIQDGEVAITIWTEDNQEKVLSRLVKGDFLGELAVLDGSPRSASAKVRKDAMLLEMKRNDLVAFLHSRPGVSLTMMGVIAERLRKANEMMEQSSARNVNVEIEHVLSFSDKVAAKISGIIGTWEFLIAFATVYSSWLVLNIYGWLFQPIDPFPFNFFNFLLASLTAIQAPIILMSQNRQADIERLRSELDYHTNVKAEMQIQSLHVKVDELRASELHDLKTIIHNQQHEMQQLRKQVEGLGKN